MSVLGVIGCGKMAQALLEGLSKHRPWPFANLLIDDVDEQRTALFIEQFGAEKVSTTTLIKKSDLVILAVKPGQIEGVLCQTAAAWKPGQLMISVAAGISTAYLQKHLPEGVLVVRVMPNLPALVGEGITAICAGTGVEEEHLRQAENLMSGIGVTIRVEEKKMNAVTAVSGSGPAYAMLVVEAMMEAAVHIGLDWAVARELVLTTWSGSIKMLEVTGQHPAVLKNQVSSPGGTTIAGLRQLEEQGLRHAFFSAVERAYQRAAQLGQE